MSAAEVERNHGILFVVSAPSGTGKSTLVARVLGEVENLQFVVSHTTRTPRTGERDGREYHFVNDEEFGRLEAAGEFLETATVHGRRYGTSRLAVERIAATGRDVLLDLDVQGAASIREQNPDVVLIFILPPDFEALTDRLSGRGTPEEERQVRLANARNEVKEIDRFDYVVINARIEQSLADLMAIIRAERCRQPRRTGGLQGVVATFRNN